LDVIRCVVWRVADLRPFAGSALVVDDQVGSKWLLPCGFQTTSFEVKGCARVRVVVE
jgi:hypothetical protein